MSWLVQTAEPDVLSPAYPYIVTNYVVISTYYYDDPSKLLHLAGCILHITTY
jgi:hypothetical protein